MEISMVYTGTGCPWDFNGMQGIQMGKRVQGTWVAKSKRWYNGVHSSAGSENGQRGVGV